MKALIIVDMLNDFASAAQSQDGGRPMTVLASIRRLLDHARADDEWLVVYANDAHRADDREVAIWGRHALAGTPGACVVEALAPIGAEREIVVTKRFYGAFDGTDLEDVLFDFDVSDVILTGQGIKVGIRHTAYGAFMAGYDIFVPMDAVCTTGEPEQQAALGDLKDMYGATLTTSTALIGRPVLRTAVSNPAQ